MSNSTQEHSRGVVISVWGSSGSGKSLLSVALANKLTEGANRVCVISYDRISQTLRSFLPFEAVPTSKSIGRLLSETMPLVERDVLDCTYFHRKNGNLGFIATTEEDTLYSWTHLSKDRFVELLNILTAITDAVIVDCNTNPLNDDITFSALEVSDAVLRVLSADIKGIAFNTAMTASLTAEKYAMDKQIVVLNQTRQFTPVAELQKIIGNVKVVVPYSSEADERYNSGELVQGFARREGVQFKKAVAQIAKEVASHIAEQ
ncbi:MAG: adenylyl-sulfate kinase [Eubacteriales bacterium]|nr:adenylyl-sulfate kinase [Eubacteriales bacterium]MDD4291893.1 adenylyl-sulfate kinase [Clostridia bacterium]